MLRFLLISSFIVLTLDVRSQNEDLDSISRAQYVQRFPDYFFIWPVIKQRASSFVLQSTSNPNYKLSYSPNIRFYAGLGFYVFEIGFQFVVAIPRPSSSINEYGETNSLDLQANLVGKNWVLDGFTENYKGYYLEDASNPLPSGTPKLQRRDIETWNSGLTGIFFANNRRYSVRASYNFYERQVRSAGSLLLLGSYNRYILKADSVVYGSVSKDILGGEGDFRKMNYSIVALAPGYGYTYVFKNWFAGATVAVGPAINWFNYETLQSAKSVIQIRPYFNWRASIGYNSERVFAGVTYSSQTFDVEYENINFTSRNGSLRIAIGYRFREVGILKKRASEFLKPKTR